MTNNDTNHSSSNGSSKPQFHGSAANSQAGGEDEGKLLRVLLASLKGRYPYAIALGVILAAALGTAGWMSTIPIYESTGYVRIKAYTPKILFDNENSGTMPRYDNYLKSQAETIRSRRVIDVAMQADEWKPYTQGISPQAKDQFLGKLAVFAQPEVEQIIVKFKHENPAAAEAATSVVITAYEELQANIDREQELSRLAVLEELRASYSSQLSQLRFQIEQVDRALGSQGIAAWHQAKVTQYASYEQQIEELSAELAGLEALKRQREESGDQSVGLPEELEGEDVNPLIPRIETEIARLRDETTLLIGRLGENHRSVKQNLDKVYLLEAELKRIRNEQYVGPRSPKNGAPVDVLAQRIAQTTSQVERLTQQAEVTRKELENLAVKLRQIDELRHQEQELSTSLAQTRSRINQLNIESELDDRVQVLSKGDTSWQPVNGSQRMARAGMGGVTGFAVGFVAIGLLGLRRKTVGRSDMLALDIGDRPLLGLMPELDVKLRRDDPQQQTALASVDHIRSLIHMDLDTHQGNTIAVTGPQSGSGKTTLALTLAMSFADSGSKVLLVDLDVVGGGLSSQVRARRRKRLGQILCEITDLDPHRVEEAMLRIDGSGKQLGQYLVEEGLVHQEDVDIALAKQRQEMGVRQALSGAEFEHCTFPIGPVGLDVLPLRSDDNKRIGRVGPKAIKQLFERAREAYDVVIIDTGPAPGCVETSLAAAAADMTVVVVSKNDVRQDVRACSDFLESIRANIYGYVMNRVDTRDMMSSKHSSSFQRTSKNPDMDNPIFDAMDLGAIRSAEASESTAGSR